MDIIKIEYYSTDDGTQDEQYFGPVYDGEELAEQIRATIASATQESDKEVAEVFVEVITLTEIDEIDEGASVESIAAEAVTWLIQAVKEDSHVGLGTAWTRVPRYRPQEVVQSAVLNDPLEHHFATEGK